MLKAGRSLASTTLPIESQTTKSNKVSAISELEVSLSFIIASLLQIVLLEPLFNH